MGCSSLFCLPYKRAGAGFLRFSQGSWPARCKSKWACQCRQLSRRRISGVLSWHRCQSSWQGRRIRQEFSCWFYQVSVVSLHFSVRSKGANYAMIAAAGAAAGATLMPMVMKAQIMAAKADKIWVRAYWVIWNSFSCSRIIPAMWATEHTSCQNGCNPKIPCVIVFLAANKHWNFFTYWEIVPIIRCA